MQRGRFGETRGGFLIIPDTQVSPQFLGGKLLDFALNTVNGTFLKFFFQKLKAAGIILNDICRHSGLVKCPIVFCIYFNLIS